jgi:hypothetical protein
MPLLVLSYPDLTHADYTWIQNIRAKHDQLYYDVVEPHFTFVFPVSSLDQDTFVAHVKKQAQGFAICPFVLRRAVIAKDAFKAYTHIFLLPDEGYRTMVKMHDRLYTGPLASELRLDIPFIPHIGAGNAMDALVCERLAGELNARNFSIPGEVTALDVVRYERGQVESVEHIRLVESP